MMHITPDNKNNQFEDKKAWESTGGLLSYEDILNNINQYADINKVGQWRFLSSLEELSTDSKNDILKVLEKRGIDEKAGGASGLAYYPSMELQGELFEYERKLPLFFDCDRMYRQSWLYDTKNKELWESALKVAELHQLVGHGTRGAFRELHSHLDVMQNAMPLNYHWALLSVIIEGSIIKGDAGVIAPFPEGYKHDPLNAADYGPCYILFNSKYRGIDCHGDFCGFASEPSKREEHAFYLVPNEDYKNFLIKGIELALKYNFINDEISEKEKLKIFTYSDFADDPKLS